MMNYENNIGKRVTKKSLKKSGAVRQPKPFKSGFFANTIKGIMEHPILKIPAYTFEEDDSYVECRRCYLIGNIKGVSPKKVTLIKEKLWDKLHIGDVTKEQLKDNVNKIKEFKADKSDEVISFVEKILDWFTYGTDMDNYEILPKEDVPTAKEVYETLQNL